MIDRKFIIWAINPCNQKRYTEKDSVLFCAKDKALLPALDAYFAACMRLNCSPEHMASISLLIERVTAFQLTESKVPDTDTDCEIDRCIGGNV